MPNRYKLTHYIRKLLAYFSLAPDCSPLCVLPEVLDLNAAERVLAVIPHPDDEAIGTGGTLALLAERAEVHVVLVTDGSGAGGLPAGASEIRKAELKDSLRILGIKNYTCLDEPDGAFENNPVFISSVEAIMQTVQPNWVFLPFVSDSHRDHARIGTALYELFQRKHNGLTVLFYEVWTPLPVTHVVDIGAVIDKKLAALSCHKTALACGNYLHAAKGLAAYRSLYLPNANESSYAEAFWVKNLP